MSKNHGLSYSTSLRLEDFHHHHNYNNIHVGKAVNSNINNQVKPMKYQTDRMKEREGIFLTVVFVAQAASTDQTEQCEKSSSNFKLLSNRTEI